MRATLKQRAVASVLALLLAAATVIDGDLAAKARDVLVPPWPILVLALPSGYLTGRLLQRFWPEYSPFRLPEE